MHSDWGTIALGERADIVISNVDKHILPGETRVYLCNYLDVYRNRRLHRSMEFAVGTVRTGELARFQLRKDDVLITKDSETPDDIGVPAVVVEDIPNTVCGYHLALLRPKGGLDSRFLCYVLQSEIAKRHFLRYASGVTRFGLSIRAIASLPVPAAPRDDQLAIVRILDVVDSAIGHVQQAVKKAEQLRLSLLSDLLSVGLDDNNRVRIPEQSPTQFSGTAVGRLPRAWRLSRIGAEFELQNGFTLNENRRARNRRRPYLRVANVHRDALLLNDIQELEAADSEFAPRVLKVDDLLVVEGHADRMQIGRCARVTEEAQGLTFQNHLFRLRSNGDVLPYFACLWLNSHHAQRYWNARCATSSGLNTINQRMLKMLVIPIPPVSEQRAIVEIIRVQRDQLESLIAKREKLVTLKASLMHDLLTGSVRLSNNHLQTVGAL